MKLPPAVAFRLKNQCPSRLAKKASRVKRTYASMPNSAVASCFDDQSTNYELFEVSFGRNFMLNDVTSEYFWGPAHLLKIRMCGSNSTCMYTEASLKVRLLIEKNGSFVQVVNDVGRGETYRATLLLFLKLNPAIQILATKR